MSDRKYKLDHNAIHLRAMRDTMDELMTWISGFKSGVRTSGGGNIVMPLDGYALHLGQIRMLLTELTHQAEAKDKP